MNDFAIGFLITCLGSFFIYLMLKTVKQIDNLNNRLKDWEDSKK